MLKLSLSIMDKFKTMKIPVDLKSEIMNCIKKNGTLIIHVDELCQKLDMCKKEVGLSDI